MRFQILLNHLFGHLPNCGTELSPCPKMPTPIFLLQRREFLKQPTSCIAFDSPHNLTRCHIGRLIKKYFLKKLIVVSVKSLGKPIMSNDGTTHFANGYLAIPVKRCLFQSPMNTVLGSLTFLSENIT